MTNASKSGPSCERIIHDEQAGTLKRGHVVKPAGKVAEHLEDIRQKAFELSVQKCSTDEGVPIIKPYENKKKTITTSQDRDGCKMATI